MSDIWAAGSIVTGVTQLPGKQMMEPVFNHRCMACKDRTT